MELISREEAIRCVKENSYCLGGDLIEINGYCAVKDIEELPAIESRPTGRWHQSFWKMPTAREVRLFYFYECDFCKNEVLVERIDGYNYCPHCGARME